MDIKDKFINYYKYVETLTLDKEIIDLERICRFLQIKQQYVASVFYIFYIIKSKLNIEPDDIVVQCTSIMLACKMEGIHRPRDKIIKYAFILNNIEMESDLIEYYFDCIMKTEIEICEVLDFKLEPLCFYEKMEIIYEKIKTKFKSITVGSIIMNDIIIKPVSVVFEIEEIVLSCFFVQYLINFKNINEIEADEELVKQFLEEIKMDDINVDAIVFISREICKIYEMEDII